MSEMTTDPWDAARTSFREWARLARGNATTEAARQVLLGVLRASENVDKHSRWVFGGVGALISFSIINIDRIASVVGHSALYWTLVGLCISLVLGALEAWMALQVQTFLSVESSIRTSLLTVLGEYESEEKELEEAAEVLGERIETTVDMQVVVGHLLAATPWFLRRKLQHQFVAGLQDPLQPYRRCVRKAAWQSYLALGQVISIPAALVMLGAFK